MHYRQLLYSRYNSNHLSHFRSHSKENLASYNRSFKSWYGQILPSKKESQIVDIACGIGEFVNFLHCLGYENTSGVDAGLEQIEIGRELGIKNLIQSDANAFLTQWPSTFDLLSAHDLIEHFTKDELFEFLQNCFLSLKPGGQMLISTSNAQTFYGARYRYADFTHELSFTPQSLLQVLSTIGFQNIYIFPKKPVASGLRSSIRLLLWDILEKFLRLVLVAGEGTRKGAGRDFHIFTEAMSALATRPE